MAGVSVAVITMVMRTALVVATAVISSVVVIVFVGEIRSLQKRDAIRARGRKLRGA